MDNPYVQYRSRPVAARGPTGQEIGNHSVTLQRITCHVLLDCDSWSYVSLCITKAKSIRSFLSHNTTVLLEYARNTFHRTFDLKWLKAVTTWPMCCSKVCSGNKRTRMLSAANPVWFTKRPAMPNSVLREPDTWPPPWNTISAPYIETLREISNCLYRRVAT